VTGDALSFDDPNGFETVVSLETLEHVPDPRALVVHLRELLRPGGTIIASAPVTPSTDANPHHLTDFTERSFRGLFGGLQLAEIDHLLQVQPYSPFGVVSRSEARMGQIRSGLVGYYLGHPGALLRRVWATLRYGFSNRYLTLALRDVTGKG